MKQNIAKFLGLNPEDISENYYFVDGFSQVEIAKLKADGKFVLEATNWNPSENMVWGKEKKEVVAIGWGHPLMGIFNEEFLNEEKPINIFRLNKEQLYDVRKSEWKWVFVARKITVYPENLLGKGSPELEKALLERVKKGTIAKQIAQKLIDFYY